jgi:hypothetical protein
MITISQALHSLRPNIPWSLNGDDVAGITWHTEGVEPLTEAEVTKEMNRLEKAQATEAAEREASRQSAINKLSALGLDALEVQAIIGTV